MADFTTANLCGGSDKLNKILTDVKTLKDGIIAKHGADASAALSTVETLVTDVTASLKDMIPELPTIPNINVQAEFEELKSIVDTTTKAGKAQYDAKVESIKGQFGDTLKANGIDVDDMSKQVKEGIADACDAIPNLQIAAGESIPIELPANIKLPDAEAVKETISKTSTDVVTLVTKELEVIKDETPGTTKVTETTAETTSTTPKTVTSTSTKKLIKVSDTGGDITIESDITADVDAANERYRQEQIAERTLIPGEYTSANGSKRLLQRFSDAKIWDLEERVIGEKGKYLSKNKTRRYFESDTDDAGGRTDKSFEEARDIGDWNWKEDDDGYIYYDRRYKRYRLT